jgi:hypothetical protein
MKKKQKKPKCTLTQAHRALVKKASKGKNPVVCHFTNDNVPKFLKKLDKKLERDKRKKPIPTTD